MPYVLAKELRDAGFPIKKHVPTRYKAGIATPTLEELIEAHRKPLQIIVFESGATAMSLVGDGLACTAPTATEAVAGLWLSLNRKV